MNFVVSLCSLPRFYKRAISLAMDAGFIIISFALAYWARLGDFRTFLEPPTIYVLALTLLISLLAFTRLGLYRAILRYLTFHALLVVSIGAVISALSIVTLSFFYQAQIPRTVPVIYLAFVSIMCGGSRMVLRSLLLQYSMKERDSVLIFGAGNSGRQLAIALRQSEDYRVRGFLDHDKLLKKTVIQGINVFSSEELEPLVKRMRISKVLLALPNSSRAERKVIIDGLLHLPVEVLTVPDIDDIVSGKASIDQLKDVPIEDLLGREPVSPKKELMQENIFGKVVMVTGAGGSIGSELCRQIARLQPKLLVLFELSEFALYQIDKELRELNDSEQLNLEIVPLMGSVQNRSRLLSAMKSLGVDTIYHAAAYKHVPLVEYNVVEGIRNNVFGTYHTAKAAIEAGVESFVLISTDKAVRPTNVMGASKRMAELVLQALAAEEGAETRFCMVRFGNVLGSSGSVIPLFKRQIAEGGPITVTHPEIIRYFMTIPEASQLVLQAGAMGEGGDVFVLDMGEPVKIVDLAENLVQLSGLELKSEDKPAGDIEITFTGLRPGEKLFEELLIGDNVAKTAHKQIMSAKEAYLPLSEFSQILTSLDQACSRLDHVRIRSILVHAPTGFAPTDGIGDLVWNEAIKKDKEAAKALSDNVVEIGYAG